MIGPPPRSPPFPTTPLPRSPPPRAAPPTRRRVRARRSGAGARRSGVPQLTRWRSFVLERRDDVQPRGAPGRERSEEHTSELQSRQYLVCRLLLEKKKKKLTH